MHNKITPPTDWCQTPFSNLDQPHFQVTPPVYVLGMAFYGVEHPFSQCYPHHSHSKSKLQNCISKWGEINYTLVETRAF